MRQIPALYRALRRAVALFAASLASCGGSGGGPEPRAFLFTFNADTEGWETGFADYPFGTTPAEQETIDQSFELEAGQTAMPPPLNTADGAVRLSGNNHSDDLFMFLKRRITGLDPETRYQLELRVVIGTNVPTGCAGIGGSPGEAVFVKGGASAIEPVRVVDIGSSGNWVINVDKGEQANPGADAQVLGDVANSKDCDSGDFSYELKTLSNLALPVFYVTTDENGEAWLLVGTDSGFEGITTIYYTEIEAIFLK